MDQIAYYERFDELKRMVDQRASIPPYAYFIMGPYGDHDEGLDYCWDCLQGHLPADLEVGEHWGGGYVMESDGGARCEDCGKLLDYTLTDYGVATELAHFEQSRAPDLSNADECFQLARIAWGICDDDTEKIKAFVALFTHESADPLIPLDKPK